MQTRTMSGSSPLPTVQDASEAVGAALSQLAGFPRPVGEAGLQLPRRPSGCQLEATIETTFT